MLNELILHRAVGTHLATGRISTVEAHKRIGQAIIVVELSLNLPLPHLMRNRVIDIEQRHRIVAHAHADVFR